MEVKKQSRASSMASASALLAAAVMSDDAEIITDRAAAIKRAKVRAVRES